MSYILEALKKSEQERERERGALPDIKSVHSPSSATHAGERRWWPFILIAVIAVAGAAVTVFFVKEINPLSRQAGLEQSSPSPTKVNPVVETPARQKPELAAKPSSDVESDRTNTNTSLKKFHTAFRICDYIFVMDLQK